MVVVVAVVAVVAVSVVVAVMVVVVVLVVLAVVVVVVAVVLIVVIVVVTAVAVTVQSSRGRRWWCHGEGRHISHFGAFFLDFLEAFTDADAGAETSVSWCSASPASSSRARFGMCAVRR